MLTLPPSSSQSNRSLFASTELDLSGPFTKHACQCEYTPRYPHTPPPPLLTQAGHTSPGRRPDISYHQRRSRRSHIRTSLPEWHNRQHHRLRVPLLPRWSRSPGELIPEPSERHQARSYPGSWIEGLWQPV